MTFPFRLFPLEHLSKILEENRKTLKCNPKQTHDSNVLGMSSRASVVQGRASVTGHTCRHVHAYVNMHPYTHTKPGGENLALRDIPSAQLLPMLTS